MMKILSRENSLMVVAMVAAALQSVNALADFNCGTDISYKWKQIIPAEKGSEAKELEEHWVSLSEVGASEEEVKAKLKVKVEQGKKDAMMKCAERHENLSGCIANRYTSLGNFYPNLGFAAKKNIDDAIKSDCEKAQGRCLTARSSELDCKELAMPTPPPEAEADGKDGKDKKDAKKDKK